MIKKMLLIPAMLVVTQIISVLFMRKHKSKKQARSELMMLAFIGIIVGIVAYGISLRMS